VLNVQWIRLFYDIEYVNGFFSFILGIPLRLVPVSSFGLLNQAKGSTIGTRCKLVPVVAGRLGDWAA
jgi:hypothetical protein